MKHLYQYLSIIILILISSCTSSRYYTQSNSAQNYSQQPEDISYQQFYNDLSPYGNWVNDPQYGYVWVPGIAGFRPYSTNGNWVYTDYGWTWASNYNWGWAPFHYGRWVNDMSYGWMWIPGNEWAPAWVSWRGGGDYYGWAPLGPGMSVNISVGSIPANNWTFVPNRYITSSRINDYYVTPSRNVTIINNTTIINNITVVNNSRTRPSYNSGPNATDVERYTNSKIRKINVVESNQPGSPQINNNSIRVYRPAIKQEPSTNIRPSRVIDRDQINRDNRTNNNNQSVPPVREIPNNQAPQINRNEPPVNNTPTVNPNRNNTPERTSPNNQPAPQINRNQTPVNNFPSTNPNRNSEPVRTFQNNTETPPTQTNRNQQQQNETPRNNSQPVNNAPVQTPQRNIERSNAPVRQLNSGAQKNQKNQRSVVPNNGNTHQLNKKVVKENKETKTKTKVRKPKEEKKDD
ncbi:MAG TPA: DUF6600 domain-containing protein [Hanamia sp.]